MNGGHEIELKRILVPHDAKEVGNRVIGFQYDRAQTFCQSLQLPHIPRCLSKQEVKVQRCDRRALKSGCCIADEHSLQPLLAEGLGQRKQDGPGIHSRSP